MTLGRQFPSVFQRVVAFSELAHNRLRSAVRPPYSQLFLVDDGADWVLSWEMREVGRIASKIGIQVSATEYPFGIRRQALFYADQFILTQPVLFEGGNRVGVSYFHGRSLAVEPSFGACYQALLRHHERIQRIQVSHSAMRDFVLESGISPDKVFLIPIGVNVSYFQVQTPESRRQARQAYDLPQSAVVVGSFQKDGVGWGEGLQPKKIKGPHVFLKVIELLKPHVRELFVLLSGPARGYVKAGLERLGVPYRHLYVKDYPEVGRLFQALDLYLVTSCEEGGPKAVLESMATGVPLVTTRVGQAIDLVRHGENGWIAEIEDAERLAELAHYVIEHRNSLDSVLGDGRQTAEANAYEAQTSLWHEFFRGFVEFS